MLARSAITSCWLRQAYLNSLRRAVAKSQSESVRNLDAKPSSLRGAPRPQLPQYGLASAAEHAPLTAKKKEKVEQVVLGRQAVACA